MVEVDIVAAVVPFDVVVVVEELAVTQRGNQPPSRDLLRVGLNDFELFFFFKVIRAHPQQVTWLSGWSPASFSIHNYDVKRNNNSNNDHYSDGKFPKGVFFLCFRVFTYFFVFSYDNHVDGLNNHNDNRNDGHDNRTIINTDATIGSKRRWQEQ